MNDILATFQREASDGQVKAFERKLAQMPQVDIPTRVFAGHGMVTRVIYIPAGVALSGKKHLQGQHNILISGTIEVRVGADIVRMTGPEVVVSPPGTKRIAVAITDCMWATTVICDKTTNEEIEAQIIDPTDEIPTVNLGGEPCLITH